MKPSSLTRRIQNLPVLFLILVNVILGLFTFRDYGFALDEPLFYGYADAVGYAYSPAAWIKPGFDLENAYGPSAGDHKNRGPAYLLLARGPAHLLQAAGLDQASAWHLVNFLAFQAGIFCFFLLARRWMGPWAAFFATAFFSSQPVLWEHAFINPKDPPFLTFFLITLELGFRMADRLAAAPPGSKLRSILPHILLPAILLGLTTSIRILGPLAALLVGLYFLLLRKPARIWWFIPYGLIAILVVIATWPYLWEAPLQNFISTLGFMADNPTELRVLFYGEIYRADALPLRYLPSLLLFCLTEPVWPLAALGAITALVRTFRRQIEWRSLLAVLLWFVIPMVYVLVVRPPMYDGFRHFMFIVPPLFILGGLALDTLFKWLQKTWLRVLVVGLLLVPAALADVQLHPYQYTYYNQFLGGTRNASYRFETDYWETCYKDAIQIVNTFTGQETTVYVRREGYIASYYADDHVHIVDGSYSRTGPQVGQYVLGASRADPSIQRYRGSNQMIVVGRQGAVFCVVEYKSK